MNKFWGKVRTDQKRGNKLGFPTANLNLTKNIPEGIYISKVIIQGKKHQALTFIGQVKTFDEKKFMAEIYILDFKKNIYGKWMTVELLKKIRVNKKFNSPQELIEQIKKDEQVARKYFRRLKISC